MSDPSSSASQKASARNARRSRRQSLSSVQIVFALLLSIGLLLVINFSGRIARGQQMETARRQLQSTLDVLQIQSESLQRERDYAASDASIEEWAHQEGKMVREGEILIIPIPGGGQAEPTPTPTPPALIIAPPTPQQDEPNWSLWWNLFFDGEPPF
ncbi:septum formation initiator family protein [Aggregatilinea lenta]|uniref:septum formation initiator family protein n=1 Tax=Aggregatilinea lenta TaxID=913108 RepID=UPI0013C2BBA0|nr:septum formation initiator family protein [Aggregatilinea lenta]